MLRATPLVLRKAHTEVRNLAASKHAKDCGCEPCITFRTLNRQIVGGFVSVLPNDLASQIAEEVKSWPKNW